MSPIEDVRAANDDRYQLEDSINTAIHALQQALHHHKHLDHAQGSIYTEIAQANLATVATIEDRLIDYQGRAEHYTEQALEEA